jgi:class 3 adenylate cyclase
MDISTLAPSAETDPAAKRRIMAFFRRSASPGAAAALNRMNAQIDTRAVLPAIAVPTLLVQRRGDREVNVEEERWIASQIPGSKYVELDGDDHVPWTGDTDELLDEVEEFLTGARRGVTDRVLATVLFTDIVGSSERATALGDRAWADLLERHHELVRRELARFGGREVDTAGDGFFASFDGPARAIRCASAIVAAVLDLGIEVRVGVHTGARIASHAQSGEVLVSSTVKDLVAGSGLAFEDRGTRELKGIPGEWRLFSVER